jgi:hypothetical protein
MSMNATQTLSIPRPARLPADIASLASIAALSFHPSQSAERRARMDHIAGLIESALGR